MSTRLADLLPMTERSAGVHISEIISDLAVKLGHYEKREGPIPDDVANKMALGNALEHAIIERHVQDAPDRYVKPGELECDGLFLTPDLVDVIDACVHEIKLTWLNSRHDNEATMWRFWTQARCYCHALGFDTARLTVVFVNGNYAGSGPVGLTWEHVFTPAELRENWALMTSHARVLARAKNGG